MFAAFYGNVDAIELLASSDANLSLVDKFGRSTMHYAAQSDSTKLVQTLFLTTKGSDIVVKVSKDVAPNAEEDLKWDGPTDDRYEGMEDDLMLLDRVHCNDAEVEEKPCTT